MLFRFLILVHVCAAFPLKCPKPAQWSTRARGFCQDPNKYSCLKNDLINGYSENCTIFDFLQPGRKHVLRGGLDADMCSFERYQPWPITFYTNVSTNCIFLKSACNEEGQVVYDNGNRNTDIKCRCDYTRGYDFLNKPQNPCFCEPSKEDCSCFLKTCPKATDKLSSDYECHQENKNLTVSECEEIIYQRVNTTRNKYIMEYISLREKRSNTVQYKIILTVICIGLIFFFCMGVLLDTLLERFIWEVYFIYEPLSYIELREGETVTLTYEMSANRFPVSFLKDNQFIAETRSIKKRVAGCSKELEFKNVAPSDAGKYCLKVEGNTSMNSHLTELLIHPMFTSKINPQMCIEGHKLHLACEVYAENIEVKWYKEDAQLHECKNILIHKERFQRMLTIDQTTLADSGNYYVKAGKVEMCIPVTVKDMLRRPLIDVTIMEGLDAKFELETEEENVPVQWFYNRKEIIESTERKQLSRVQERVHTLTILQTRLEDSGKYSIKIEAYDKIVELNVKEMPETIKNMSVYDREAFLKAANSGTTTRYNIRVMIVGKQSAGKTCLLRRLMNEEIDDVISTDGINIERRKCHIDIKTGEWHFSSSDKKNQDFSTDQEKELADCGFWDFAGQKEFYATHQTFLSSNAVYLLVVDISEDFKSKTYENMIEKEFDTIGEYIDFWLDNIHCYCTDDKKTLTPGNKDRILNPPVIIVGTGIDKVPSNEIEDRKQKFLTHLSDTMSTQPKRRHLRKPHFLSNKFPSNTRQEFEELRKDIFCKAKDLSNWEENLPLRWVVLEKEICSIKVKKDILHAEAEGQTPAFENKKVMLHSEAQSLADKCSFPNVKQETFELNSFLKYEHEIGNIVFFKEVKEYIVLDPEWLVDVFRCFVSHEYNDDTLGMTEWDVLAKTGKLEDTLIETLLQKVPCLILRKHKNYLLELMEEFSIIVKPKASINDIYMPCMIKPRPFQEILGKVDVETEYCKKSSWFCLVFNFLPPSYFNHILVSFVKNNPLFYDKKDSRLGIYRNVGIFQLNNTGSEILVMCLSKNLIAMKVVQFNSSEDVCYSYIKTQLISLVESIKLRYRINVNYDIRFKCQGGSLYGNEGIGYDEAMEKSEYRCTDHNEMHSSRSIYKYWLKEEEVEDELKKNGRRRCNYCKNMSVYKCYDCNKVLCTDCSRKHDNEEKYISHTMQHISDTFIMNCKWQTEHIVRDIECLPNGEIIVASWLHPQIILFSVSGKQRAALQLKSKPRQMVVVDKTTVAVFLPINGLAIVDIQQNHVQYIRNNAIPNSSDTLIYIENEFYILLSEKHDIVVINMSGSVKRRIPLSFIPCGMCYDVDSQHIYCIDINKRQLICIDRDGTNIFTFTDPNMTNLTDLTIDNDGNVLMLCRKVDSGYVFKVDSNGEKSEVVITNMNTIFYDHPRICYDHSTNSVVIGMRRTVYIYKKKE